VASEQPSEPLGPLPSAASRLSLSGETAGSIRVPPALGPGDVWFVWLLAIGAIAIPVIVLVCVSSIPRDTLAWHAVSVSMQRGDFLVPVMLLCAETIRRWWREVKAGRAILRYVRTVATLACGTAAFICVVAMTTAATIPITPRTGNSIAEITAGGLMVALLLGTAAVSASLRKGDGKR
jgi:hypothetical protein